MVYQICYNRKVLFDIDYYLDMDVEQNDWGEPSMWHVELHCTPFISGAVNFICYALNPEMREEFIKDCMEIEELRGWVWETHRNQPRKSEEAKRDMSDWIEYIDAKLRGFCEKYGLYLNID